jgi:urease accessory protein
MHCDESLPNMAYLYMMSTSGGTLGGDSHHIDITVGENAAAHITTQGATRIYGTRSEAAAQATEITLQGESYLEFMPDQTIPYGNARYSQTTRITASRTATLVYMDVVASGRRAMGESFQYDLFRTETVARNDVGDVIFHDAAVLEPKRRGITGYGIMGGHTVMGTVYILAPKSHTARLYDMINPRVSNHPTILGGASTMRGGAGVLVRLLGKDARSVMSLARDVASIVRKELLGVPLPDDRKS